MFQVSFPNPSTLHQKKLMTIDLPPGLSRRAEAPGRPTSHGLQDASTSLGPAISHLRGLGVRGVLDVSILLD